MGAPEKQPNETYRKQGNYYTCIDIRPPDVPSSEWKRLYFFPDSTQESGFYQYEKPDYDWYIETAIEKLDKLPINEQVGLTWEFVFDFRQAIRQRFQRTHDTKPYDHPPCRNTRSAVGKWIERVFEKYGD
ncbi:hypothetical protein [Spirosoma foliorum]|uniref:Uncharacterized protein n=1 Tax=Spirosoma foliorum TaxID=2710596 RepID=A0A7G5H2M0_9BACT|nr:hypothetical protein [Spirosoma foliorum]QMW05362.1 hypothetical protein H3H32_10955 [Spirosoma foliorum]